MPAQPFKEFARHYDRFMMRYVDYRGWVDYVERILKRFKVEPKTVLDLACGTGIPTILMAKRGFRMVGVDRSAEMLEVLKGKRFGLPIETVEADMTDFRLERPVDAAICLYDSINYLLSEDDLVRCFTCVRRSLAPDGLFTFDMNTVYSLSTFWGSRTTPRNVEGVSSVWQNTYDEKTRISTLHLTFWEEPANEVRNQIPDSRRQKSEAGSGERSAVGGEPTRFEEVHQERAYSQQEVEQALERAGFGRVWFYSHNTFLPVAPLTTRMMVVARRPDE